MPASDSDSSYSSNDDESTDSSEDESCSGTVENDRKKSALAQFDGFDDEDDDSDNSVAEKMKSIIELRKSLGMDNDAEFMKELREKEEEKKRLAAMSVEERMEYEESKAGDVMSKIRERHAEKMKEVEAKRKAESDAAEAERAQIEAEAARQALIREQRERIDREFQEEEERRKAEKKAKKKKKEEDTTKVSLDVQSCKKQLIYSSLTPCYSIHS
jgi:colicin import membrane protein